jgi:predicted nucleic acid-binding protein
MTVAVRDCVVDASVAIKRCLAEALSDRADALLALATADPPARFFVPDLFVVECANILWKHVRRSGYPADQARLDVQSLRALRLERVPTADLVEDALQLALAHAITAYDACYVALARREGVPLVMADDRLVRALATAGMSIVALGECQV